VLGDPHWSSDSTKVLVRYQLNPGLLPAGEDEYKVFLFDLAPRSPADPGSAGQSRDKFSVRRPPSFRALTLSGAGFDSRRLHHFL